MSDNNRFLSLRLPLHLQDFRSQYVTFQIKEVTLTKTLLKRIILINIHCGTLSVYFDLNRDAILIRFELRAKGSYVLQRERAYVLNMENGWSGARYQHRREIFQMFLSDLRSIYNERKNCVILLKLFSVTKMIPDELERVIRDHCLLKFPKVMIFDEQDKSSIRSL